MDQEQQNKSVEVKDFVGKRVEVEGSFGTIKYSGPLKHEGRPNGSEDQLWFGVEWDDNQRGKHNGTVENYTYFETSGKGNNGSLIKFEKANLGSHILDSILSKYFKDTISGELRQIIKNQIEQQQSDEIQQQLNGNIKSSNEQNKENAKQISQLDKKQVLVEYDENAYFETFRKEKKMVQFYGFDVIWEKLNNMRELKEISLKGLKISNIGEEGYFRRILPNLRVLSLEGNMLYDWNQVYQIGYELPQLEELSLSLNILKDPAPVLNQNTIMCTHNGQQIQYSPIGIFKNLKSIVLISMKINWKILSNVLPAFPNIKELIICRNNMTDYENLTFRENQDLQQLQFLNLEETGQNSFEGLKKFGQLPLLNKLILNKNQLKSLGMNFGNIFKNITQLSLEQNLIEDPKICTEISQFPELTYLNIKHNPVADIFGKSYVRQRAVAENINLKVINGSDLKKYERKDCEIYYLRKIFDDFFAKFNQVYYEYNLQQFLDWANETNPRITYLLQKYGNPYEQQEKPKTLITEESAPKNVMLKLTIVIAGGPLLGKEPLTKKFPDNTTVGSLKNIFSKILNIPINEQLIYYKVTQNDPMEILDEDHKQITFYGIKEGSEIIVDTKQQ